jgi:hypothetical protein
MTNTQTAAPLYSINNNQLIGQFMTTVFGNQRVLSFRHVAPDNNLGVQDFEIQIVIGGVNQTGDTTNVLTFTFNYHLKLLSFSFAKNTTEAFYRAAEISAIADMFRPTSS